jgi:MFS family permease
VITPAVGKTNIGYVMACFGAADALGSVISGKLSDRVGRIPLIYFGALLQYIVIFVLALYVPPQNEFGSLIMMAILWGFSDGIWNTLLNGSVFPPCSLLYSFLTPQPLFLFFVFVFFFTFLIFIFLVFISSRLSFLFVIFVPCPLFLAMLGSMFSQDAPAAFSNL